MSDATRISITELCSEQYGYESVEEAIIEERWMTDSVVPALCSEGCQVEQDGRCEHGNPSIVLALGYI